jgi:hypothetical protein
MFFWGKEKYNEIVAKTQMIAPTINMIKDRLMDILYSFSSAFITGKKSVIPNRTWSSPPPAPIPPDTAPSRNKRLAH